VPDDSEKSKQELLDEYCRIVTFVRRPECFQRAREIIDEFRRRKRDEQPAVPKRRRLPKHDGLLA
jgi:hypothetical protein